MWTLKNRQWRTRPFLIAVVLLMLLTEAFAEEIFFPPLNIRKGSVVKIPIMIDKADNIAGVKLGLTYDPETLRFQEGQKTPKSQSMMHVINDKKPGRLIIVMAAAKGIGGRNFTLLELIFEARKREGANRETRITITDAQLMSDQLKDIPCKVKPGVFQIE